MTKKEIIIQYMNDLENELTENLKANRLLDLENELEKLSISKELCEDKHYATKVKENRWIVRQ